MKTSLQNDENAVRGGTTERRRDARPAAAAQPPAQPPRTRLIAACGWPTDAAPQARRRGKR